MRKCLNCNSYYTNNYFLNSGKNSYYTLNCIYCRYKFEDKLVKDGILKNKREHGCCACCCIQ